MRRFFSGQTWNNGYKTESICRPSGNEYHKG